LINAGHANDIIDVWSDRRADCNSDHFLVQVKFKPKIFVFGIRSDKKMKRSVTKLMQTGM
jgi:hypothetical protein